MKNAVKSGNKGKMSLCHFLKSIELIAMKLYPEFTLEESLQHVIESHLMKLASHDENGEIVQDESKQHV